MVSRAKFAKAAGAGAVLMIPGITGLDSARALAEDPDFALPIICHPAILGAMLGGGSDEACRGFSHKALLGLLPRLAGCDATIFPSFGGRFGFSERECLDILEGSRRRMGSMPAILPCPGGGMTMEKVAAMRESYGEDVCFLIGGSLIGHSEDLVANAKHFMKIAGREDLYGPLEHGKTDRSSHAVSAPPTAAARRAEPGSGGELDRLKKQMATMEANLSKVTDMYLASEKARAEAAKHAASHGGVGVAAREHAPAPGSTLAPGVKAPPTPVEGNYSKVFNRPENRPEDWSWERIPQEMYKQDGGSFKGCSRFELLGKRGESTVFHVRYFEVEPGGWTTLEHHRHEHAVIGLRGEGVIQLGPHVYPVRVGDCAYTAPGDTHQLRNEPDAKEPFGFVCVVAADRDRPVEVDPGEFLKSAAAKHALQHGMRDAIEAQAKHRAEHAKAAGAAGAVAEGSACEWKPGAKKKQAAAAVESGSACEWTPGKKRG